MDEKTPGNPMRGTDATSLAAIHILTNTLDNAAVEVFITNPAVYSEILAFLKGALTEIVDLVPRIESRHLGDGCPDGYTLCDNGRCSPCCGFEF